MPTVRAIKPILAASLVCLVGASLAASQHDHSNDPVAALPTPPITRALPTSPLEHLTQLAPGISVGDALVVLDGTTLIDQGPPDGMEVLACLASGKNHESLIQLVSDNGQIAKFAFMSKLALADGVPAAEGQSLPARGTPLRVQAQWQDPRTQQWLTIDASCLVRDRVIDGGYPPLPFVYTGSRMEVLQGRERFMLDNSKSVLVNYDEADALFGSPFPGAEADDRFEANSAVAPPPKTAVRLIFSAVTLPLTLTMNARGELLEAPTAGAAPPTALSDTALGAVLVRHFAPYAKPELFALDIVVANDTDRAHDVAARSRIMAVAIATKVWCVPVFTLAKPAAP